MAPWRRTATIAWRPTRVIRFRGLRRWSRSRIGSALRGVRCRFEGGGDRRERTLLQLAEQPAGLRDRGTDLRDRRASGACHPPPLGHHDARVRVTGGAHERAVAAGRRRPQRDRADDAGGEDLDRVLHGAEFVEDPEDRLVVHVLELLRDTGAGADRVERALPDRIEPGRGGGERVRCGAGHGSIQTRTTDIRTATESSADLGIYPTVDVCSRALRQAQGTGVFGGRCAAGEAARGPFDRLRETGLRGCRGRSGRSLGVPFDRLRERR